MNTIDGCANGDWCTGKIADSAPSKGVGVRILHIIGSLENGGAEAVLYRLVTYSSKDVQHHIVSFAAPDWYSPLLEDQGIKVYHLNVESPIPRCMALLRLWRIIRDFGPDVVQCWMYRSNFVGGMVARLAGVPVAWGIHCSSLDPLSVGARGWAYASGAVARWVPSRVINCSTRSAEIHEKIGFAHAPVQVIHNGYDTDIFFPDESGRRRLRQEFGIADDVFLLGTVARWHPQKDHRNLLAALKILQERGATKWRCLLVGPGMSLENDELATALEQTGTRNHVICTGPRRDIPHVMRALDLHVLPSAGSEAFPNVVAEAMACETPCLVTDVGDSAYMAGEIGWVVQPKSPAQLADKIALAVEEWSSRPAKWAERCRKARERVLENFTLQPMAEEYIRTWRSIMKEPA